MESFQFDRESIYQQYKLQKLQLSSVILQAFLKLIIVASCVWQVVRLPHYDFFTIDNMNHLIVLFLALIILYLPKGARFSYILGLFLMLLMDFLLADFSFWKFPEFNGLGVANSVLIFNHGRLEFIYNQKLGYFAIFSYVGSWIFCAIRTDFIKTVPPPDAIFIVFFYVILQLMWYTYRTSKDYEEIERKMQLEMKQENIQNLINAIPEGVLVMNQSFKKMMNNSAYEILLHDCDVLALTFPGDGSSQNVNLSELMERFRKSKGMTANFGVCKNQEFYLECTASKTEWNKQLAMVFTFREVSNVINLQKQVNLTSKALKILQGLSHELKTPLSHMINDYEEILYSDIDMQAHIKKCMNKSLGSSNFLLSLIRDMIDYSHTKFSNLGVSFTWVQPSKVIIDCIEILKSMNEEFKFNFKQEDELLEVYTDFKKLKQCLLSFFSICLGPLKKSTINITLQKRENKVEICIYFESTQNYSMSAESALEFIRKSLRMKISNKIIKLICLKELEVIVKGNNIIELCLGFEYINKEEWSLEEVSLEGTVNLSKRVSGTIMSEIVDILIVDDIETNVFILEKMIENMWETCKCEGNHRKYSVHSAKSGKEAIEFIKNAEKVKSGYRIVIMDCLMPDMDGWETSIKIQRLFERKEICVLPFIIAYSAFDSKEDIEKSERSGMCEHLSKPSPKQEICRVLNQWINRDQHFNDLS